MKSWIKYLSILIACGVPLVFNPAYIDGYNLPKITLFYSLTTAMLALWIISWFRDGKIKIKIPALFFAALFLVLANALAAVFSINPLQSFWGQYRFYAFGLLPLITAVVFSFLLVQADIEKSIFNWAILGAALSAIYGFLGPGQEIRFNTTFGSPIYFSVFAAGLAPLALARFYENKNRLVWLITLTILASGLAATNSRAAWIAVGVSVMVFLLTALFRKQLKIKQALIAFGLAAALGSFLLINPSSFSKLKTAFNVSESSNFSRHEGWKAGLKIIKENPIFGIGPSNFQLAFMRHKTIDYVRALGGEMAQGHAHNDIIQAAATTGLVGLLAYLCFWLMLLARGFKNTKNGLFESGIFAGMIALLVFNQFNNGMVAELMLLWLMAGWVSRVDKEAKVFEARAPKSNLAIFVIVIASVFLLCLLLKPFRAEMKFVDGNIAAVSGNLKEAFSDFEETIKINPLPTNYYTGLFDLGHIIAQQTVSPAYRNQIFDKLEKYALQNSRINSNDPDSHCNLGIVYAWESQLMGGNKLEQARQAFEKSVTIDRYFTQGWLGLAKIYFAQNNRAKSAECFAKVLEIDPQNQEALK